MITVVSEIGAAPWRELGSRGVATHVFKLLLDVRHGTVGEFNIANKKNMIFTMILIQIISSFK